MPIFHHDPDEKRRKAEARERRRATLEALQRGEIPPSVLQRLGHVGDGRAFTSTLSVSDALLARQTGLRPLAHVMGSAVFNLQQWRRPTVDGEAMDLRIWNDARAQALQRLRQEAEVAGADAVIDVQLSKHDLRWARGTTREYMAIGTAVKVRERRGTSTGLTNLSGEDFWKLYTAGWWPCGIVAWTTVYRVLRGEPMNVANTEELTDSSRGMYRAAHLTIVEAHRQVRALNGQGLVGTVVEHDTWEEEAVQVMQLQKEEEEERGQRVIYRDRDGRPLYPQPVREEIEDEHALYCRFDLVGTAVTRYAQRQSIRPQPILWLNAPRHAVHVYEASGEHAGVESERETEA